MAILGMLNTEQFQADRFKNVRRSVFYNYPNGAAPLTGLLTMLRQEDTDDPEFFWYEKRLQTQRTLTLANVTGTWATTAAGGTDSGTFTFTAGNTYYFAVTDATIFRVGHVLKLNKMPNSGTATDCSGIVLALNTASTPNIVSIRSLKTVVTVTNSASSVGNEVLIIGSSFSQGAIDQSTGIYNKPGQVGNFTQIFRTPFSMTGSALRTAVKYDDTGAYRDLAKENSIYHMIEMEKMFMFGQKVEYVDAASGLPTYTTGGIIQNFLVNWEAGNYANFNNTAATVDTDDNKRIITNASGNLSESIYDGYVERVFRTTNNVANEKLVFCGSGFLNVINQMYKSKSVLNGELPLTDTYGMDVVKHRSPFGTLYYKTHPLFTQNPIMRNNALILDVHNLVYRYMQGRDTTLLKKRQPNNADYRTDEWLSECGLECRYPEASMYIQNVTGYAP